MSDNEEVCDIAKQCGDSNICVVAVRSIGMRIVLRDCRQIGWRGLEKVGFEFCFTILLARDKTVFGDDGTVIVGSIASWVAQVTPVRAAICHINVEDGNAEAKVILVEDSLKLRIEKISTLAKAKPSPGVESTSLELYDRVRGRWTLLCVQVSVVCW